MRGLLEKDFRLAFVKKQTILIFLMMSVIMGMTMDGAFVVGYLTMLSTIVAVGTISYDEYDNGFSFLMTLPFDRKTYVREKYLFCLMISVAAWLVGTVLYGISLAFRPGDSSLMQELPMLVAVIPVMYLSSCILIPLQLKYGSEKSRIVLWLVFGGIAVVIIAARRFTDAGEKPLSGLVSMLESTSPAVLILAVTAVCALIAWASCLWSTRIMEKKEF